VDGEHCPVARGGGESARRGHGDSDTARQHGNRCHQQRADHMPDAPRRKSRD